MDLSNNPNTLWMSIFVDELARCGLEAVCIAPGSRSTPITLAFANHPTVRVYRHLDERSAGFFALGMAMATRKPVALVCTSGTAAANFHPAVIEAFYSQIPLIVMTADRPAELRGSGANQTIDQVKMYGDHVRWSVEMPTPEANAPEVVLRHLRTLAARAFSTAAGQVQGPVHLNFPFRKPLEPQDVSSASNSSGTSDTVQFNHPFTSFNRGTLFPRAEDISAVAEAINKYPHGLIICGPNCPGEGFPEAVAALAMRAGYPILADPLSNVRHGHHVNDLILGGYHTWLSILDNESPSLILRFGSVSTSSALSAYLEKVMPANHYHVREDGQWADDLHLTRNFIQCDPEAFCKTLTTDLDRVLFDPDPTWRTRFTDLESRTWELFERELQTTPFFDGSAVAQIVSSLPDGAILFAGNSMPIRHLDTFDRPSLKWFTSFGNRGASGIDGNVSTALGLAAATGRHVVTLLGDITFYHDMNGLLAIRQHQLSNVTFVILNNNGGSIFYRLPIAQHDPPFTDLFLTPHGLTFEHAAAMYGLDYTAIEAGPEAAAQISSLMNESHGPHLIEICSDSRQDFLQMSALSKRVKTALYISEHLTI